MFDILVDTPQKRRELWLLIGLSVCFLSLMGDFFFCFGLIGKTSITSLYQTVQGLDTGFYSKLVFLLISNQRPLLQAFTTLDWIVFIMMFGLALSHRTKESRRVLGIMLIIYAVRMLSIAGIGAYLMFLASNKQIVDLMVAISLSVKILLLLTVMMMILNGVAWVMIARSYYVNMLSPH